jgi:hypothetical protein
VNGAFVAYLVRALALGGPAYMRSVQEASQGPRGALGVIRETFEKPEERLSDLLKVRPQPHTIFKVAGGIVPVAMLLPLVLVGLVVPYFILTHFFAPSPYSR